MPEHRGIFHLDQYNLNNVLFQESIFSALVITIYVMTNDMLQKHLIHEKFPLHLKYAITFITMFLSTMVAINILLYLFGYKSQFSKRW